MSAASYCADDSVPPLLDLEYSTDGYEVTDLRPVRTGPGPVAEGIHTPPSSPAQSRPRMPTTGRLVMAHSAEPSLFAVSPAGPSLSNATSATIPAATSHLSYSQPRSRGSAAAVAATGKTGESYVTLQVSPASQTSVGSPRSAGGGGGQLQKQPSIRSFTSNNAATSNGLMSMVASWFGNALAAGGGSGGGRQGRGNGRLGTESFSNYGHVSHACEQRVLTEIYIHVSFIRHYVNPKGRTVNCL